MPARTVFTHPSLAAAAALVSVALMLTSCAAEPTGATPGGHDLTPGELSGGSKTSTPPTPRDATVTPEPDAPATDKTHESGDAGSGRQLDGETQESGDLREGTHGGRDPVSVDRHPQLPAGFPLDLVPIPGDARIDDAGERGTGAWFVVVRSSTLAEANALLERIARDGGLTEQHRETGADESLAVVLSGGTVSVEAVTHRRGGAGILSLDVTNSPQ